MNSIILAVLLTFIPVAEAATCRPISKAEDRDLYDEVAIEMVRGAAFNAFDAQELAESLVNNRRTLFGSMGPDGPAPDDAQFYGRVMGSMMTRSLTDDARFGVHKSDSQLVIKMAGEAIAARRRFMPQVCERP